MTPPNVQFIPAAPSGLSLIIHDAFSGSGSIAGRTPDTVDNGNTWSIPETGVGISVTSGYAYRSATDNNQFHDNAVIDIGTTGPFRVEQLVRYISQGVGCTFWNNDTSISETNIVHKIGFLADLHNLQNVVSGSVTLNYYINSGVVSAATTYLLVTEVSGSTCVSSVYDSTGTTLIDQETDVVFGVTPSSLVGIHFGGSSVNNNEQVLDFKVYA